MRKIHKKSPKPELSVILPCRNEEKSLGFCLKEIKKALGDNKIKAEIIVSDSSFDNSPKIAKKHKAVLLKHDIEGYGAAYLKAFKLVKGKYIFMADPDYTYDFKEIPAFLKELKKDCDFVIGNRFGGKMEKGAMSALHRYMGNPIFSFLLLLFFKIRIKDPHCGMRAVKKSAIEKLNLQTKGMEFASEMLIKAVKNNLKIKELPIDYYKRKGNSKLRSFSDGWKHLRFLLLYTPFFLFFIPGAVFFFLGLVIFTFLYLGPQEILGLKFYFHPMFFSLALMIVGYQLVIFGFFAKTYSLSHLGEKSSFLDKFYKYITIEKAAGFGALIFVLGLGIYIYILLKWLLSDFAALNEAKNALLALALIVFGVQTFFSSFILSILGIKK